MKKLLIIPLLFCSVLFGQTTYYVAKTGNDGTGDGSSGSPWLTITHAEATMSGGDTCYVKAGTYTERVVVIGIDGTPSARTVFKAYQNDEVIIDGQNAGTDSEGDVVRIYDDYVDFYGFEIRNANQDMGVSVALGIGVDIRGDNVTLSHCRIHETLNNGITAGGGDSVIIEFNTIYNCSLLNYNGNLTTNGGGSWGAAVILTGSAGTPILYPIIRGNVIYDIWGEGPTVRYAKYALFEDNIVYNCFSVLLYVQNTSYAKVQRNIVYSTGFMQNDLDLDNAQVGIGIWDESYNSPRVSRTTVINNLVYGCDRNLVLSSADTTLIVGNTFVNSIGESNVQLGMGEVHTIGYFANNIIDENDGTPPTYLIFIQGTEAANITYFNNLYSRALSGEWETPASVASDVIGDPLLDKTGGTGAGQLSLLYFKLGALSPAIESGKDLTDLLGIYYDTANVAQDYEQSSRINARDIGAWESAGTPVTPPILATILTSPETSLKSIMVTLNGVVSSDGGATVTERGFCYGTSANPTTSSSKVIISGTTGVITKQISVSSNTTYHVRSYAINSVGTSYGADVEFTTPTYSPATNSSGKYYYFNGLRLIIK